MGKKYELIGAVAALRTARHQIERAQESVDEADRELRDTPQWKCFSEMTAYKAGIQKMAADLQQTVRALAIEIYAETGDKKVWPGIGIRVSEEIEYDSAEALAWCRENAPGLLVVDTKAFEKVAVAMGAPVKRIAKITPTIAADLDKAQE
jgi:hypothetical protein